MGLFKKTKKLIEVECINKKNLNYLVEIEEHIDPKNAKRLKKIKSLSYQKKAYFIQFNGDVYAKAVLGLREEITAILLKATKGEHVIISLESPGGTVTGYGLVAEQIERLRNAGLYVVAVVDQVAASGGYMAAVVADEIVVAKRAVIGSVGVVLHMPNYEELLKKIGVSFKDYTAGEFKRTVTPYKKPEEEAEKHLEKELERIHTAFKEHISEFRKEKLKKEIEEIGTGETWSGKEALELGLVDKIGITDDVLMNYIKSNHLVLKIKYNMPKEKTGLVLGFASKLSESFVKNIAIQIENLFNKKDNFKI